MSHKKTSSPRVLHADRSTYLNASLTTLGAILAGVSFFALPIATSAFWPLSTTAQASNAGGDAPLLHDSSLPLLEAAINTDPNPSKGQSELLLTDGSALMANSGPEGILPASDNDAPSAGDTNNTIASYTVKQGDSISSIASSFEISANTILWANNLTSKSTIKPGMTLIVLPVSGIQYTVRKGDTLASVARKYDADAGEIATVNGIDSGTLTAGVDIIIPGGTLTETAAPKKTTVAKVAVKSSSASSNSSSASSKSSSGLWSNPLPGGILTQGIHDNNAVDIGAHSGTPIYAAAGGSVIFVSENGSYNHGWGNDVIINHPNGSQTLYSHMSKVSASVGESVSGGTLIGYVGETGRATGNHLHFEVHGARNPFAGCKLLKSCSI